MREPQSGPPPAPSRAGDEAASQLLQAMESFGLGACLEARPAGGTASPKWAVVTSRGRYLVRMRPSEFGADEAIRFDHEVRWRLSSAGLPVPTPVARQDGSTWLRIGGHVYEVLEWMEGERWNERDEAIPASVGSFLARFHTALGDTLPPGRPVRHREDHPDLLEPHLAALRELASGDPQRRGLDEAARQLQRVRAELDFRLYAGLPHRLIHGDFHPGNVRFRGAEVAAVYDFDYVDLQARARDVADGLMFFCSRRDGVFDPDNIHSLTQPMFPEPERSAVLIRAYAQVSPLTEPEWQALPLLIRSRWIQMRLRGARKVAPDCRIDFALHGFLRVIEWLDREGPAFFSNLRQGRSPLRIGSDAN